MRKSTNDCMQTWKKRADLDDGKETWIDANKKKGFLWGFHSVDIHPAQVNLSDSGHRRALEDIHHLN
ncbi:unnamed protein product [Adineta ricciae]|uniref:Uncharacterized protein n=1 Tax=Adineta ricciae TaxID=249248 RepID=A0A815M1Q8_ADIRI|nr:unnamed protein product [Adineta ricciae]